jgi:putative ABC transport system substrate-binding protein
MSYGTNVADTWRSVPGFVDRILKGAKPADMAVEVITRREFVVDLKVARQLGLTVPQTMLARADRVID